MSMKKQMASKMAKEFKNGGHKRDRKKLGKLAKVEVVAPAGKMPEALDTAQKVSQSLGKADLKGELMKRRKMAAKNGGILDTAAGKKYNGPGRQELEKSPSRKDIKEKLKEAFKKPRKEQA